MPLSLIFCKDFHNNESKNYRDLGLLLEKIYYIEGENLPNHVLSGENIALPLLKNKSLKVFDFLSNPRILSYIMDLNPGENSLLILPEVFYNSFDKLLIGSKNGLAFKIDLNENTIIDFPWQIKSKGRILLPDVQSNDSSVKDDILKILKQKQKTLEKTLLMLFQNANNIEAVHKIRVNARTLRSLLDFLRPFTDQEKNKFLRDFLKNLALKFSRIREEDVLLKQIEDYQKENNDILKNYYQITALIKSQRKNEMNELLREMIFQNSLAIIPELSDILNNLDLKEDSLANKINKRYFNQMIDFQLAANHNDYENMSGTHNLRKTAKKMRYVMENFGVYINSLDDNISKGFKDIQTKLGNLCDARTNQLMLKELLNKNFAWEEDLNHLITLNADWENELMKKIKEEKKF